MQWSGLWSGAMPRPATTQHPAPCWLPVRVAAGRLSLQKQFPAAAGLCWQPASDVSLPVLCRYFDVSAGSGPEAQTGQRAVIHFDVKWRGITFITTRQGVGVTGGEPFGFDIGAAPAAGGALKVGEGGGKPVGRWRHGWHGRCRCKRPWMAGAGAGGRYFELRLGGTNYVSFHCLLHMADVGRIHHLHAVFSTASIHGIHPHPGTSTPTPPQPCVQGLDLTVRGMRLGGQRKALVPPQLAYGARGFGEIPPNATLEVGAMKGGWVGGWVGLGGGCVRVCWCSAAPAPFMLVS